MSAAMVLREDQIVRYARHVLLPEVGGRGQARLLAASVAVEIGPDRAAEVVALAYLAAAGVGRLGLRGPVDGAVGPDEAAAGVLYGAADAGRPRGAALRARIAALNPDVEVTAAATGGAWIELADDLEHGVLDLGTDLAAALVRGGTAAARVLLRIARAAAPEAAAR